MKHFIYVIILSLILVLPQSLWAEDTIRVLMLKNPNGNIPSEQAESCGNLNGKVFVNGQFYTGSLEVLRDENGLYLVNNLPFEKYIEGVVASETGKEWEIEALKVQAVISRTYAVFHKILNAEKDFHLTSSVLHQVYKENNKIHPLIRHAVEETRGEILVYEGKPIKAFYHSTCVGKTELPEEVWGRKYPYLKSVDCNSKSSPYEHWWKRFSFEEIEKAIGISDIKDINIASYTSTGRVRALKVVYVSHLAKGGEGEFSDQDSTPGIEHLIKAAELRKLLGYKELPSTHFSLATTDSGVIIEGSGWGHGVGLCQWGALEMARQGKNYREILAHYYQGTSLKRFQRSR